jgi:hypothetical protein
MRVFSQRWEFWREAHLSLAAVEVLVQLRKDSLILDLYSVSLRPNKKQLIAWAH